MSPARDTPDSSRPTSVNARHRDMTSTNPLTIVLKLGTSSICDEVTFTPRLAVLSALVETVVSLRASGHRVIIVSSGAVGTGMRSLGLKEKPTEMAMKQAVAAVGQGRLLSLYDDLFKLFNIPIAQVLLTRNDIADRSQYRNACNTLSALLDTGVIPIVNENDAISVVQVKFGDNDTLSALVSGMVDADILFLLTDVDSLYTDNPRTNPAAEPIRVVEDIPALKETIEVDSAGSAVGTGGMATKLIAADLATAAGVTTVITRGSASERVPAIISQLYSIPLPSYASPLPENQCLYTHFPAQAIPLGDRKWWIRHGLHPHGTIYVDSGAVKGLIERKASLFAAGIVDVEGSFVAQQGVRVVWSEMDVEIARGVVNYSIAEVERLVGHNSAEIRDILGYADAECIIHRDNMARELSPDQLDDIPPTIKAAA